MTAFQRRPKRRRVFPFPNNHRRPSKVFFSTLITLLLTFFLLSVYGLAFFFLFLQSLSSLFFLLLVYGLAFPHFFTAQQVTNATGFGVRIEENTFNDTCWSIREVKNWMVSQCAEPAEQVTIYRRQAFRKISERLSNSSKFSWTRLRADMRPSVPYSRGFKGFVKPIKKWFFQHFTVA